MQIIPLSEGSFTIDGTKLFVPFSEEKDKLEDRAKGSLLVEIQPFVVKTGRDVILLDTGLGFEIDNELQIIVNLKKSGVDPGSVTKVVMSHLHKDHAGAVGRERKGLGSQLAFPSATYYIQRSEFHFAFEKGFPSYITDDLTALQNSSNVVLLDGDETIDRYISCRLTGAHSPFHQVIWIREGNETIFFGGDDAPQLKQMKHRYIAKYDHDGKKAMELRSEWWDQGTKENWTFLFYHDINTPFANGSNDNVNSN